MEKVPKCKHGHPWYCVVCEMEKVPKCKHGHPWYCSHCAAVGE